jgi:hypothetical protein
MAATIPVLHFLKPVDVDLKGHPSRAADSCWGSLLDGLRPVDQARFAEFCEMERALLGRSPKA